jgi:tetratricopeptide (TPR) repeat protein
MNIGAFGPEQIVHDRYLYLPLLGFLILLVPAFTSLLQRIGGERMTRSLFPIFIAALVVSVPLAAQAVIYNRAWTSDLALSEWGTRSDPTAALNYQRYGTSLYEAKRLEEAVAAFNRSIEIAPTASTYVVRATAWIDQHKFAEAERDLRAVTSQKKVDAYTLYRAYRDLGVCLSNQGKTNEAADAIKQGRVRLAPYNAALTAKLSSILWRAGRKDEALSELNAARAQARTEGLPESRLLLYGLGLLNIELGHPKEAREAFLEFLSVTQGMLTPGVKQARSEAEMHLRKL